MRMDQFPLVQLVRLLCHKLPPLVSLADKAGTARITPATGRSGQVRHGGGTPCRTAQVITAAVQHDLPLWAAAGALDAGEQLDPTGQAAAVAAHALVMI